MNDNFLSQSLEVLSLYLQYRVAKCDMAAGTASPTQELFVNSYEQLVAQTQAKARLQLMMAEAENITRKRQAFERKYGVGFLERIGC